MFDRRSLVVSLIGIAIASSLGPGPVAAAGARSIVGSWEVTITPEVGGPPPFRALFTFHADGTVVESDAGPPAPHLFTAGHGVWQRSGRRQFRVIYRQINFDESANLTGMFTGRVQFTLDSAGTAIGGPSVAEFYDPGGQLVFSGSGTAQGARIELQPIP